MEVKWTKEQQRAIYDKGTNILVAAAAGSGKTAVLVERIINKIINEKIDIDKLLVVTFTNAAATEMRERVLKAIYQRLEETPEDLHLQKQIILLNKCNISTIHSFCIEVIKNNFFEINVSPNFKVADSAEIELFKHDAIEEVFEELYEKEDKDFLKLIDLYVGYRDDDVLKEIVLQIYKYIQSTAFPEEWLQEKVEKLNVDINKDFATTDWGKIIIDSFKEEIKLNIEILKQLKCKLQVEPDMVKFYETICDDISIFEEIEKKENWDDIYEYLQNLKQKSWPIDKKADASLKEYAKEIRDNTKETIKEAQKKYFICTSKQANEDISSMYKVLNSLKKIVLQFSKKYQKLKEEKGLIDFNDIEHYALKILVKKDENGNYIKTDVAKQYEEKFAEIAIDEYQDSNMVQEYILSTISTGKNLFMVGDVKQSIYKFRHARPELFLEKYEKYQDTINDIGYKIKLFKNFRSSKNVLDVTNSIFQSIMSKKCGDIDYNEEEFLNLGAEYNENLKNSAELHILNINKGEEEEQLSDIELEAGFVANRISEIIKGDYIILDKRDGYRKVTFKDIVILLRTTSNVATIYERELAKKGFPVFSDTATNYFETLEIQTVLALLKIVNNPNDDISIATVLRSPIGKFTDNEMMKIRLFYKLGNFYEALKKAKTIENQIIKNKIEELENLLKDLREKQEYYKLDELIWYIYEKTGYYNFVGMMQNGDIRQANLKMLFEKAKSYEESSLKGLPNFINFIDKVIKTGSDMGAPKLIGENENVIRIMSIHKSKGLEFPVVFLCGTGKQFNFRDLTQKILIDYDLGFGPEYINSDMKIQYTTLAKEAIKIKSKQEVISEEMRLLYVALTRSKEKLIITGVNKKDKSLENDLIKGNTKLEPQIVKSAKSNLEFISLAILNNEDLKNYIKIEQHYEYDNQEEETETINSIKINNSTIDDETIKKLSWHYNYEYRNMYEAKTSVSKLAKNEEYKQNLPLPQFINEKATITKAQIGTLTHLVMQKLDFSKEYNLEKINSLLSELVSKNIITDKEKQVINIEQILAFVSTNLFKQIAKASKIFKEEAFYLNLPMKVFTEKADKENVLVQGIIDLYYVDEQDNVVLVDYKTDFVKTDEKELIEKYVGQLTLYKQAIEEATSKKVTEVYIYSTYLNKEIKVPLQNLTKIV